MGNLRCFVVLPLLCGTAWGQVSFRVTEIGVIPGYQDTQVLVQGQGGAQIINGNGQVAAVCRRNPANPSSCEGPPEYRFIAVRFTPGVGLETVSDAGSGTLSSDVLISEGGHVYGLTRVMDWHVLGQTGDGLCFWQPREADQQIWGWGVQSGRYAIVPPLLALDVRVLSASADRRASSDGGVLVSFTNENSYPNSALHTKEGGWRDLRDLLPGAAGAAAVFAVQRSDSGWTTGLITDAFGEFGRLFRFSPASGLERASLSVFSASTNPLPSAVAVDESGLVAGSVDFDPGAGFRRHAVAWVPGESEVVDLHDEAVGAQSTTLDARNGIVLGAYFVQSLQFNGTFFQWTRSGGTRLIRLDAAFNPQGEIWSVHAMNAAGTMIGHTISGEYGDVPWLWTAANGFQVVSAVLDPDTNRTWIVDELLDINDRGQIVANATDPFLPAATNKRVLILTPVNHCRADFDQQNGVQVADIFAFLRAWFANQPSADFDQMNGIQVADIFAFLRAWFAGC